MIVEGEGDKAISEVTYLEPFGVGATLYWVSVVVCVQSKLIWVTWKNLNGA